MVKQLGSKLARLAFVLDEQGDYHLADLVYHDMVKLSQTSLQFEDGRAMGGSLNNFLGTNLGKQQGIYMPNNPFASPNSGLDHALHPPTPPGPGASQAEWAQYQADMAKYNQASMGGPTHEFIENSAQYYATQAYYNALQNGMSEQEAQAEAQKMYQQTIASMTVKDGMELPAQFNQPIQYNSQLSQDIAYPG